MSAWMSMHDDEARRCFGPGGPDIVRTSREVALQGSSGSRPRDMTAEVKDMVIRRYGPNGVAVHLLLQAWMQVRWRLHEGEPTPRDNEVIRLASWEEALQDMGPTWRDALLAAGRLSQDPEVRLAWDDGERVGFDIGEHHAKFLAAAMAGELAQVGKTASAPHFFIDTMPWVIGGFWPAGWDEAAQRLRVL